jgi:hypothetical protein
MSCRLQSLLDGRKRGSRDCGTHPLNLLRATIHFSSFWVKLQVRAAAPVVLVQCALGLSSISQLMVGHLTQGWKIKAANLRPLVDEATSLIQAFGRCDLVKVPRDEIVRVLGH